MFRSLGIAFAICALSTFSYAQEFTPHSNVYKDKINFLRHLENNETFIDSDTGFYYIKGSYTYVPKYCLTNENKRGHLMQTKDNKLFCVSTN